MGKTWARSSPDLVEPFATAEQYDDSALEGVAANIKLLLKLIQDHKEACAKQKNDGRRMLRVAGMMTILDMVRTRIQKCQSFGTKLSEAELKRCKSDLKGNPIPRDKKSQESIVDEKERLKRELNASLASRKSLEIMCSGLGKEKEIMAAELARKAHELEAMEELVNDLKAQNESLMEKVQEYALQQRDRKFKTVEKEMPGNAALLDRNKVLSEQLLKSIDGYRSMKRKLKDAQEESAVIKATMEEMGAKVKGSLERIRSFKEENGVGDETIIDIEEDISELAHMFECLQVEVPRHGKKRDDCAKPSREISAC